MKVLKCLIALVAFLLLTLLLMFAAKQGFELSSVATTFGVKVPNLVHFVRFGNESVTFIEAVCMLAALKNQKPTKLYVHTDQLDFQGGKYWDVVRNASEDGIVEVKYLPSVGKEVDGDYAGVNVLKMYGGVYVCSSCYVVKNLSEFFGYEMTFGWSGGVFGRVLIADKNSGFLRRLREEFFGPNRTTLPSDGVPASVRTLPHFLAEESDFVAELLLYWDSGAWKQHYAVRVPDEHRWLLATYNPPDPAEAAEDQKEELDEAGVLDYPVNLRQMALDVYPYDDVILNHYGEIYPHLPRQKDEIIRSVYENVTESPTQLAYLLAMIDRIRRNLTYEDGIYVTY